MDSIIGESCILKYISRFYLSIFLFRDKFIIIILELFVYFGKKSYLKRMVLSFVIEIFFERFGRVMWKDWI